MNRLAGIYRIEVALPRHDAAGARPRLWADQDGTAEAIVPRELWDRVHAILAEAPRTRAGQSRSQTLALLKGLIFGLDGRAMSPSHTTRRGRQYRYYVAQAVQKGSVDQRTDLGSVEI